MSSQPPNLSLARYRLVFETADALRLPAYSGSAWRGALGHTLKKLVCVTRERRCPDCLLYRSCIYPYIFETPSNPEIGFLGKVDAAPHPYVLRPETLGQRHVNPGETLAIQLTLFGHGNRHLPYLIHALERAGEHGLTRTRSRLRLRRVEQAEGQSWSKIYRPPGRLKPNSPLCPSLPALPKQLRLAFITPLRLKSKGRRVTPESFDFAALFAPLLRRIALLTQYHSDTPLSVDARTLVDQSSSVQVLDKNLRWREYTRYSNRQQNTMQIGGLIGDIQLDGTELATFWPYLWLGQWTHVGNLTTMGLGYYRIEESLPGKLASRENNDVGIDHTDH